MPTTLTFDNLVEAAKQCALGVKWKASIASWIHQRNIAANCLSLLKELESGKYRLSGYVTFDVSEPKKRTIKSPKFRDRVVQRAMCNAGLYNDLTRGNIYDNGACQNGKGTVFAMERLHCLMQRYFRHHGSDGWVLRLDIRKFFDSLPHSKLKEMVAKNVTNAEFAERVNEIIDSFDDPGIGLGSQISQLLAIAYLSGIDHYIKETLRIKAYVRYSDDMVLIHSDKTFLSKAMEDIKNRLGAIGLSLNKKSMLHPLSHGINFLKFRFLLTNTGKVVKILSRKNFTRMKRIIKKMKSSPEKRSKDDIQNTFKSWKSHAELGNSNSKIRRMAQWVES